MLFPEIQSSIKAYDERRDFIICENKDEAILFTTKYFLSIGESSIQKKNLFSVALSGGNTPKAVYALLASPLYRDFIDWSKALIFFSDERSLPKDHQENNYFAAMQAGLSSLPIKEESIFRMQAEETPELKAKDYEQLIEEKLQGNPFDLVMLGMGVDGHTASLFPKTHALHSPKRKVVANFVPKLNTWRMTFTFTLINDAEHIIVLALGTDKAPMIKKVFRESISSDEAPSVSIGTARHKALWVLDREAAHEL